MLFGKPIPWIKEYLENTYRLKQYGWDFLILTDLEHFKRLVRYKLGIEPCLDPNSTKYWDYRPFLGLILEDHLRGYDFWGHTDHDVVYGRLDAWCKDSILADCDVFSNDPNAMCGFFSLYRNNPGINKLCHSLNGGNWQQLLETDEVFVLDEVGMTEVMREQRAAGTVRWVDHFWQGNDTDGVGAVAMNELGELFHNGKCVMAYHFRRTKQWPL